MSNNTAIAASIESLLASGLSAQAVAARGFDEAQVQQASRRLLFGARYGDANPQADDDKHLKLIAKANNGMGFPYCVKAS